MDTRARRTPRAFRRRQRPFHAARRQRAQRLARVAPHQSRPRRRLPPRNHRRPRRRRGAAGASWRDVPMQKNGDAWQIELPLAEAGFFKAKAYLLDAERLAALAGRPGRRHQRPSQFCPHRQHHLLRLHPAVWRHEKSAVHRATKNSKLNSSRSTKEISPSFRPPANCATWPASCRTSSRRSAAASCICCRCIRRPTTYARFGRFGSPYAALDLTAD